MTPDTRRRAVIVATAVLALSAVAGVGVLLLLRGTDSTTPVVTATTPAPPSPSPSPVPSTAPPPAPSPTPGSPVWSPSDAFLTPEQAAQAVPGDWRPSDTPTGPEPLLDPCGGDAVPLAEDLQDQDGRALVAERETATDELLQQVHRYADEQDAAAALDTYRERVAACPRTPLDEGDEIESTVVAERSSDDRLLVRQRYCAPDCTDLATTYALVAGSGSGVTVLRYAVGEDGDPFEAAGALLDASAEALAAAVRD